MADDGKREEPGPTDLPALNAKHRLLVVAPTGMLDLSDGSGATYAADGCEIHPQTMEEDLDMFDKDFCFVRGKKGRTVCLTAHENPELKPGTIALNDVACKNLGITPDAMEFAGVRYAGDEVRILKSVSVAVLEDTVGDRTEDDIVGYLQKYYSSGHRMAAMKDTLFKVKAAFGDPLWFKVVDIQFADKACTDLAGIVLPPPGRADAPPTELLMADPISKEDGEGSLNRVGYADIGGLKSQLASIRDMVEMPLRHPKIYRTIGVSPPKGVLMYGPPGCGKTLIARAIANETGAHFILINGPELMGSQQGETEANIRSKFDEAKENAPAIIFIDEIDAIAPNRKDSGTNMARVVTQLLTCMNGFEDDEHVVVIGATNRPNSLDPALRRAGRFDQEMIIPVPSEEGRIEILRILAKKQKLAKDVDLAKIAHLTHGYVGADLSNLCMKAAIGCIRRNAQGVLDLEEDDIPDSFLQALEVEMEDFFKALDITGPSVLKDVLVEKPNVSFADIGGLEDVKKALQDLVRLPVEFAEKFERMGCEPRRGVLMFGLPGCGKTLLAKAMANECGANFISIKGPELMSKWYGESEENVRDLFEKARQAAPCIMFFDEIDSLAVKRGAHTISDGGASDRVVNQLLTEMQGIGKRNNVFIVGATNRPGILDSAITRPGRLDQPIEIPLPDLPARVGIFKACLRRTRVSRTLDIERLAVATDGYCGSDLSGICALASKISIRRRIEEDPEGKLEWELQPSDFAEAYALEAHLGVNVQGLTGKFFDAGADAEDSSDDEDDFYG